MTEDKKTLKLSLGERKKSNSNNKTLINDGQSVQVFKKKKHVIKPQGPSPEEVALMKEQEEARIQEQNRKLEAEKQRKEAAEKERLKREQALKAKKENELKQKKELSSEELEQRLAKIQEENARIKAEAEAEAARKLAEENSARWEQEEKERKTEVDSDYSVSSSKYVKEAEEELDREEENKSRRRNSSSMMKKSKGGREDEDREERTNLLTNFFNDQFCETSAVLRASAELIGSLVHDRRKELADQIGVTAVDLDTVKACDLCALSSFAVLLDDLVDLFFLKRARNLAAFLGRNIGRRNGLHADSGGNSGSAGVVDLDTDAGAVLVNLLAKKEQTGNIIILVDSQLCSTIRSLRRINACVLNHKKSGAAFCAKLIVIDVQKAHLTGLLTVVGSHRSHHDTVFHCHSANRERLKNVWIIAFH